MKGRKPKAAEVKRREGFPGKRGAKDRRTVLVAGRGIPKQPPGLNARAKTAWKAIVADMDAGGILDKADWPLVEVAATTIGRFREVRSALNDVGVGTDAGLKLLRQELALAGQVRQLLDQLGVGPVGRSRLNLASGGEGKGRSMDDEFESKVGASPRRLRAIQGGKP